MDNSSYIVDAFISDSFLGNPAGVCILPQWMPDDELLKIARDNGSPETALLVSQGKNWQIRWFTPVCEVDLCGHATLAAGFVLFDIVGLKQDVVRLDSGVGELTIARDGDYLILDFPARRGKPVKPSRLLLDALKIDPVEVYAGVDMMAVLESKEQVLAVNPDMQLVSQLDGRGLIITAPGDDADFVSRFFAPKIGIDEDHVTGSAHCQLTPYWAVRLGKNKLTAHQLSPRGGELVCELKDDRVLLAGKCRKADYF